MRSAAPTRCVAVFLALGAMLAAPAASTAAPDSSVGEPALQQVAKVRTDAAGRAIAFLRGSQADDGSFSSHAGPGVTALVAASLLANGLTPADPTVARALDYVAEHVQGDGGIYREGSLHRNYETCLAIYCFEAANGDGRYDKVLKDAEAYLREIQWGQNGTGTPGGTVDISHDSFGGAGYGNHKRPDLSNTSFLVEALHALGNGADDPAIQDALVFVSRCQNLETEHNQSKFPPLNPDGGFYYSIAAGGSSQAGETANGGLRSYGSMTYAGLKSMIYAGVDRDDPRVQAALEWIQANYTLETNPGMGDAGFYYYLHTFAKSLSAVGSPEIVDAQGVAHDWQSELVHGLADRQQEDGSWLNGNPRWLEGDPNLVTGYALLALSYCKP